MRYLWSLWVLVSFVLSACGGNVLTQSGAPADTRSKQEKDAEKAGTVFDEDGLFAGAGINIGGSRISPGQGGAIGVNAYLWYASLEVLSFLPIHQTDPFGGAILTDWHSPPDSPNERFKANVFISGRALRSDALKVVIFREQKDSENQWATTELNPEVARKIENAILEKARERRLQSLGSPE